MCAAMSFAIDTSVLVSSMVAEEDHHDSCLHLLNTGKPSMYSHGITETFSTMTGGRRGFRMCASQVAALLEEDYAPGIFLTTLTAPDTLRAIHETERRGIRGGAIFDYLHLVAARKAKATVFFTLNISNFSAFALADDPEIRHPSMST